MKCLFSFFLKGDMHEKEMCPRKKGVIRVKNRAEDVIKKNTHGKHRVNQTAHQHIYSSERILSSVFITMNNNHRKKNHPPKRLFDLCKVTGNL